MDHRQRVNMAALAIAIVVLLGAGVIRVLTFDDDSSAITAAGTTTSVASSTTVATEPPPTTAPPATTAAPVPPPTTAAPAPPTTAAPTTTAAPDCGKGETRATSQATVAAPNIYTLKVDVINDTTKAIAIDKLAVRLTYSDGPDDIVDFPAAKGVEVQPKETKSLTVNHTPSKSPTATHIDPLDFHVVGQPGCPPKQLKG